MNNTDYSQYRHPGTGFPESVRLEVCRERSGVMATRAMTKQEFCQQHQVSKQSLSVWFRMYANELASEYARFQIDPQERSYPTGPH